MKKISSLLIALGLVSGLSACNSGGSANNNPHATYSVAVRGNGVESDIVTMQEIRLQPLTNAQKEKATQAGLQHTLLATQMINDSYTVQQNGLKGFPDNFYNNASINNLIPLNQLAFGSCVTFATVAGLSYRNSNYSNTTDISPLDVLNAGYLLYPNNMDSTGWDGLPDAYTLLSRLEGIGYYHDYYTTNNTYKSLSQQYSNYGSSDGLTIDLLTSLPGFSSQLNDYNNLGGLNGPFTQSFANIKGKWSPLYDDVSTQNTSLVKKALDNGEVVLIGFDVYDANTPADSVACQNGGGSVDGSLSYIYNAQTNTIKFGSSTRPNTWANPSGCVLGGHEVWVVGYATAANGDTIFIIRNSWGNAGDQGQFYMTADYLNNASHDASVIY